MLCSKGGGEWGGGEMGCSILGGRGEGEGVKSGAEPKMNGGVPRYTP